MKSISAYLIVWASACLLLQVPSAQAAKFKWVDRFANTACGASEIYLGASSKHVSNIDACKKSCEDAAACTSITFYSSGWCSHFSTECTKGNDIPYSNAISIRLSRAATTASPARTAGAKFTWAGRSKNSACDAGAGEIYLGASSKQVSDEEACSKSCEDAAACKSITFWSSRWCSHFSTGGIYLGASSKKVSDEEACKKSCEDAAACKSITFWSGGWCSHFSTECTKTKADGNAISARLVSGQSSARKRFLRKSS